MAETGVVNHVSRVERYHREPWHSVGWGAQFLPWPHFHPNSASGAHLLPGGRQACRQKITIGGLQAKRAEMGVRGPCPGKMFQTTPFRWLKNAPAVQIIIFQ